VSTGALMIGLVVGNVVKPGAGLHIDPATLDGSKVADYADKAHATSLNGFLLGIVPETLLSSLTSGSILQALFVAVLAGIAMAKLGETARPIVHWVDQVGKIVFKVVDILMAFAPFGAFGAIAFTVGEFGAGALLQLGGLIVTFLGTAAAFIVLVLGAIAWAHGFSLFRLLAYLRSELLLVFGTSSSEAALPALIERLEEMGCDPVVAGVVVPAGYSFNLDGTNIYMTLAALFIAQAVGIDLPLSDQLVLMAVAMLSSRARRASRGPASSRWPPRFR
jgi:aerobic C4-dicarboxylate transport protein